jgi:hypothetical protein
MNNRMQRLRFGFRCGPARWSWLASLSALVLGLTVLAPAAAAQVVPGGGGWSPAAGASGDNTFQGFIDTPANAASVALGSSFHVSGWVVDQSAEGWAGVDGLQVMNGGTVLAQGSVGLPRPDVASVTGNGYWAASGFDALVPTSGLSAGAVTLQVVVHTPGKGSWSKPLNITLSGAGGGAVSVGGGNAEGLVLTLVAPSNGELVAANKNGIIRGVAYDTRTRAELGIGVDRVEAYLDGPRGQAGSQNIGVVNPTSTTWSITWEPTRYDAVPHHILWVYAHSAVTGEYRLITVEINIVH